jgi:hypothetical protein
MFFHQSLFMAELDPNVALAVLLGIAGITATALTSWKGTSKLYRQGQESLERMLKETERIYQQGQENTERLYQQGRENTERLYTQGEEHLNRVLEEQRKEYRLILGGLYALNISLRENRELSMRDMQKAREFADSCYKELRGVTSSS